ncbi:hypothetical protein JHK86_031749 [Glycine max]|nr:hypothetical protein JHK86_031749 [Glycine max]
MASSSFICLCFVFTLISCFGLGIPTDGYVDNHFSDKFVPLYHLDQPLVLYGDTHNNPSTSNIEHHHQWSQDKVTYPISTHVKFSSSECCLKSPLKFSFALTEKKMEKDEDECEKHLTLREKETQRRA